MLFMRSQLTLAAFLALLLSSAYASPSSSDPAAGPQPTPDEGKWRSFQSAGESWEMERVDEPPLELFEKKKVCRGQWCAASIAGPGAISGYPIYDLYVRDPKGTIYSVVQGSSIGDPHIFRLDETGRLTWQRWPRGWDTDRARVVDEPSLGSSSLSLHESSTGPSSESSTGPAARSSSGPATESSSGSAPEAASESAPASSTVSDPQWEAARKACALQKPEEKRDFLCNDFGCTLRLWVNDYHLESCIAWLPKAGRPMQLLARLSQPGYSSEWGWSLEGKLLTLDAAENKNGCDVSWQAILGPEVRRFPLPGEIPGLSSQQALAFLDDAEPATAVLVADRLDNVSYGPFEWAGPTDAAVRFYLALSDQWLVVQADILDDQVDTVGPASPVNCDHLEIIAKDGGSKGAMVVLIPALGKTTFLERWRNPGGAEVRKPIETARCELRSIGTGRTVACLVPRAELWPGKGPQTLELRYSDADGGHQGVLIGIEQKLEALADYPPLLTEPFIHKPQ